MQVEQAVFTSAPTRGMRGYHLVARSAGVTDSLAATLTQWGPSHDALADRHVEARSFNFFSAGDGWYGISRTVYGGSEYSGRGGLQVVSRMLVVREQQLARYQYLPLAMARTALALGHLRLTPFADRRLPTIALPAQPLAALSMRTNSQLPDQDLLDLAMRKLDQQPVALVGFDRPLEALEYLFGKTVESRRLQLCFTTGLRPSLSRPFRLQFVSSVETDVVSLLEAQGAALIGADTGQTLLAAAPTRGAGADSWSALRQRPADSGTSRSFRGRR